MEDSYANAQKNGRHREDLQHRLSNNRKLPGDNALDSPEAKSKSLVRRVDSQQSLILKVKQLRCNKNCIKDSFVRSINVFHRWIPKHVVTVDEKYLRRCLELIHLSASKAAPCNVSLNVDWGHMDVLSNGLNTAKIWSESVCDLTGFDFDCPLVAETGDVVISSSGQWIVGSIMGSKSMMNIMNSPLLCKYGSVDADANLKKESFNDFGGSICYDSMNSPGGLINCSTDKLNQEVTMPGNYKYEGQTLYERLVSMSSTNSTCSEQSSSSSCLSASVTQGMLQCTWKGGEPHFVFSLDDHKVVYVANLWKVESVDEDALDYIYLFHSGVVGQKDHDIASQLVGKMKVSTSFSLCSNNSRIMEREFVLFGDNENFHGELQIPSHDLRKNKGLSKKVAEVFWPSHSIKKRTTSKFGGSTPILENSSWEPFQDTDAFGGTSLIQNNPPANLELAAIVVKDYLPDNHQEKVGGWGLNFLKKVGVKQTTDGKEFSEPSTCARNTGDCSTSMNILVPAGLHGGPRTRNGGPSSLIERWKSGGCCDCGGWDLGCPLTVLKSRLSKKEIPLTTDAQGECKLIDLIIEGSEDGAPPLRMMNVHDGLYFVHFQSSLSALQSFSIAVAFMHSQSSALRPKNVQQLK